MMIDRIERVAAFSVARACGFAGLAGFTTMVGFAGDPVAAFKAGGFISLIATAVLWLKARNAHVRSYKATELWILLRPEERPGPAIAQQIIGGVLRDTYLRFALQAVGLAVGLLGVAVLLGLFGIGNRVW